MTLIPGLSWDVNAIPCSLQGSGSLVIVCWVGSVALAYQLSHNGTGNGAQCECGFGPPASSN